ncbi:MAG: Colicin production protein [Frankiales bacterium]|nr:Colicin production protein [Frankiales bacterium]
MTGSLLDVVLVVACLLFALSGYRQGFVVGVLSFVGFLGGGVLGAKLAPSIASSQFFSQFPRVVVGLGVVFLFASIGQLLSTVVGGALRKRLTWRPARQVDALAGAVISVVSLLLVSWLVGRAVATSPYPSLAAQVKQSAVLTTVDGLVPTSGQRFVTSFRQLVDEGGFPEVFEGLRAPDVTQVEPPDPQLARSAVVQKVEQSVLKVTGVARDCRKSVEGTGFVFAPERVMTNAHVVAGVQEPKITVEGRKLDATVVLFDPLTDVAVLAVPGLTRPALSFREEPAESGADAIVVGYPEDGPFDVRAARVRSTVPARGRDIYNSRQVEREIYALRALVRQGNSGGPLVDPQGRVLGVIFAAAADDPNEGYALTAREVADEARAGATATRRVSSQACS